MNARSISRFVSGFLAAAMLFALGGCASSSDLIITPRGGGVYGGHYDPRWSGASSGGGMTIHMPFGASGFSGASSTEATTVAANARVVIGELLATRAALQAYCNTPTLRVRMIAEDVVTSGLLSADRARFEENRPAVGQASSHWKCPDYVNQHARLLQQLRPALDVANQATGTCSYARSKRMGQVVRNDEDCQASGLEAWRDK